MTNTSNKNRGRGKRFEKQVARMVNGDRIGIFGGTDVRTDGYSIECKTRVKSTVHNFMAQAERNCIAGTTPVVIVHLKGARFESDVVCMRMRDYKKLNKDIEWNGGHDETE